MCEFRTGDYHVRGGGGDVDLSEGARVSNGVSTMSRFYTSRIVTGDSPQELSLLLLYPGVIQHTLHFGQKNIVNGVAFLLQLICLCLTETKSREFDCLCIVGSDFG